jgi:hypothetical protein
MRVGKMDFQALERSFAGRWLHGMFAFILIAFFIKVISSDRDPLPQTAARPAPTTLVASPSDPFMVEAIRLAQAQNYEDGPWGGAQRNQGPKVTIQLPGGPITLTVEQLADANYIYPQLKANPKILEGSR